MKKYNFKKLLFFLIVLLLGGTPVIRGEITSYTAGGRKAKAVKGELLVKFRTGVSKEKQNQHLKKQGAEKVRKLKKINVIKLRVPHQALVNIMKAFNNNPDIEYAEPNYIYTTQKLPPIYSDEQELENNQWGMYKIEAPGAWDIETGDGKTVIAVVDSGVDLDHIDLADNIWENSDESDNGLDSDGNGYNSDINGWDFADGDNNPNPDSDHVDAGEWHGTHVAGIAAASATDQVVGVSWSNKIMALRALSYDDGTGQVNGELADIAEAITYAADNGADIINMSLGAYENSSALKDAIDSAYGEGCVLVGASGNDDLNEIAYPAKYENVIAVGATDINDDRVDTWDWGSNYGTGLDLVAPGKDILSTYPDDNPRQAGGTSMAAPFVAGLASLMVSYYEDSGSGWDPKKIKDILITTADGINGTGYPDWDDETGYGRINSYATMSFIKSGGFASEPISPIAFPNPFNPHSENVRLRLSERNSSTVKKYKVYTLSGRLVRDESGQSGEYVNWDGKNNAGDDCASGLYFFQLETFDGEDEVGKVTILR
ncbi:MAG: S8 family serine peptidase [Elusimicrobiota bacterium]